jgi:hypothetical protein
MPSRTYAFAPRSERDGPRLVRAQNSVLTAGSLGSITETDAVMARATQFRDDDPFIAASLNGATPLLISELLLKATQYKTSKIELEGAAESLELAINTNITTLTLRRETLRTQRNTLVERNTTLTGILETALAAQVRLDATCAEAAANVADARLYVNDTLAAANAACVGFDLPAIYSNQPSSTSPSGPTFYPSLAAFFQQPRHAVRLCPCLGPCPHGCPSICLSFL